MRVKELIQALQKIPQESHVYIWVDGDRYPITDVDDSFVDDGWVDINMKPVENFKGYAK